MSTRKFNISDAEMLDAADVFHALYLIDELVFNTFNPVIFSANFKTDFLAEIDAGRNVVKDMVIVDEQAKETEDVSIKMQECIDSFNEMRFFINRAFPDKITIRDQFGYNDYEDARKSKHQLLHFMEMLFIEATKYSAELIAQGYTAPKIAAIATLRDELRLEILEQDTFKKTRLQLTQERIDILNKPWERISDIHYAAKNIYKNNPAKLAQYALPKSSGGTPEPTITIAMATKQNPVTPINLGVKGTNGKEATANYGDSTTETKTVNESTITYFSHLHSSIGNYSMQMIATILGLLEFYAPDCKLSAINLPEGIKLRVLDLMNNLLASFFLPLSCVDMLNLQLNNNELDQASVNQVLMQLAANGKFNGSVNLGGGTNAAPSGQGIAAKNLLISRGWTVVTN